MDNAKEAFLTEVLGPGLARSTIADAETRTKELEEAQVRFKEKGGGAEPASDTAAPATITVATPNGNVAVSGDGGATFTPPADESAEEKAAPETVLAAVRDLALGFKVWTERIAVVEKAVADLGRSDDEKIAALIAPRGGPSSRTAEGASSPVLDEEKAGDLIKTITNQGEKERAAAIAPVAQYLQQIGIPTG